MNELSGTYEFVVTQKSVGKYRLRRFWMVSLYVFFVIFYIIVIGVVMHLPPLISVMPLMLWIFIFFTWRYVSIEYEYSITSGVLTFSKVYGRRTRKQMVEIRLKSAETIAPLALTLQRSKLDAFGAERVYSALSSDNAPDAYFMTFVDEDGVRCAFLFEATAQCLKICKYYNSMATVVTDVSR